MPGGPAPVGNWPAGSGGAAKAANPGIGSTRKPLLDEAQAGLNLTGRSAPFFGVMAPLSRMVACEAPVLIKSETGTGR